MCCNDYLTVRKASWLARPKKKIIELLQIAARQTRELRLMNRDNLAMKPIEQTTPLGRDLHQHTPTVGRVSIAIDKTGFHEAIDEPRRIRILRHHPIADLFRANPIAAGAGDDAQRVVLRIGNTMLLKQRRQLPAEDRVRPGKVQIRLLLKQRKGLSLADLVLEIP